ncbi:hypothetical protein HOY82DRAFT_590590 [Tuber indicum]|nr:hypothetical protein HOY82DRAFT_590590 [Tuber indicum]
MVDLAVDCGNTHRAFKGQPSSTQNLPTIRVHSQQSSNTMFRLSRQTKILSPALIHRRIWFRGFHDEFIPDSTGNDGTGNDGTRNDGTRNDGEPKVKASSDVGSKVGAGGNGHGDQSDIFWDRINRLEDKLDGSIKDHGTFKVDVIKSISELGKELRKSINDGNAGVHQEFAGVHQKFAGIHQEFTELKSDQKLMKWQLHFLFFGTSSLVLWTIKDYIQLRFPAFFGSEERTPPHKQPEAPQKKLQK